MKLCLGFPYCRENVKDDEVACRKCWRILSRRMRSEILAVIKRWKNTPTYRKIKKEAQHVIHERLKLRLKREETRRFYTVVG